MTLADGASGDAAAATRRTCTIVVCTLLSALSLSSVLARLYTRRYITKSWGVEDWLIIVSMVMALALNAGIMLGVVAFGFDRHVTELPIHKVVFAAGWLMISEFAYTLATAFARVAILVFYLRLAAGQQSKKLFTRGAKSLACFIVTYHTIYVVTLLMGCRPLAARWQRENPMWTAAHTYTCIDQSINVLFGSSVSTAEDFAIALMPAALFWDLKMPRREKLGLWALFSVGVLTGMIGIVKTYYFYHAFWKGSDWLGDCYPVVIISAFEMNVVIFGASVPALKPFCARYVTRARLSGFLSRLHRSNPKSLQPGPYPPRSRHDSCVTASHWRGPGSRGATGAFGALGLDLFDGVPGAEGLTKSRASHAGEDARWECEGGGKDLMLIEVVSRVDVEEVPMEGSRASRGGKLLAAMSRGGGDG